MSTLAIKKVVLNSPQALIRVETINDPVPGDEPDVLIPDVGPVRDALVANVDNGLENERVVLGNSDSNSDLVKAKSFLAVLKQTMNLDNMKALARSMSLVDTKPAVLTARQQKRFDEIVAELSSDEVTVELPSDETEVQP